MTQEASTLPGHMHMQIRSAAVFVIALLPVMAAAQQFLPAPLLPGAPADPNTRFEVPIFHLVKARTVRLLSPGAPTPTPGADPNAPSLAAALQEQLRLKLEGARGPVEVVVIDKFERPTLD
jgi:hypothetical protein